MNIVLVQIKTSLDEISPLPKEFPNLLFLHLGEQSCRNLGKEHWERVEILFGGHLTKDELALATNLKWIHAPNDDLSNLCLEAIESRGNILLTYSENPNASETAEFVASCILAFSKQLFQWKDATKFPTLLWDAKWADSMWNLKTKVLLQVGLSSTGLAIAALGKNLGMKVVGVHSKKSFHPACKKTLSFKELHSVLPSADVVSLSLPKHQQFNRFFGENEFNLMKDDSILIVVESNRAIDEEALAEAAKRKFRGIVIDAYKETPISSHSPLYSIPSLITTPDVARLPISQKSSIFQEFKHNLRHYLQGSFIELKTLFNPAKIAHLSRQGKLD